MSLSFVALCEVSRGLSSAAVLCELSRRLLFEFLLFVSPRITLVLRNCSDLIVGGESALVLFKKSNTTPREALGVLLESALDATIFAILSLPFVLRV